MSYLCFDRYVHLQVSVAGYHWGFLDLKLLEEEPCTFVLACRPVHIRWCAVTVYLDYPQSFVVDKPLGYCNQCLRAVCRLTASPLTVGPSLPPALWACYDLRISLNLELLFVRPRRPLFILNVESQWQALNLRPLLLDSRFHPRTHRQRPS